MVWKVEFGPAASEDLRVIFRHLRASHEGFGNPLLLAANMAADRVHAIRKNAERLADAPHIGTRVTLGGEAFRYVTMDSAIYWFTLNEQAETVEIRAVFYSGQDHLGHMRARLAVERGPEE